jgi:hypothetical protein
MDCINKSIVRRVVLAAPFFAFLVPLLWGEAIEKNVVWLDIKFREHPSTNRTIYGLWVDYVMNTSLYDPDSLDATFRDTLDSDRYAVEKIKIYLPSGHFFDTAEGGLGTYGHLNLETPKESDWPWTLPMYSFWEDAILQSAAETDGQGSATIQFQLNPPAGYSDTSPYPFHEGKDFWVFFDEEDGDIYTNPYHDWEYWIDSSVEVWIHDYELNRSVQSFCSLGQSDYWTHEQSGATHILYPVFLPTADSLTWGSWQVDANGYCDTTPWLGLVYVNEAPWVWSVDLNGWLYCPDPSNEWIYAPN